MFIYLAFRVGGATMLLGFTAALFVHGGWQAAAAALAMLGGILFVASLAVVLAIGERATAAEQRTSVRTASGAPAESVARSAPAPAAPGLQGRVRSKATPGAGVVSSPAHLPARA